MIRLKTVFIRKRNVGTVIPTHDHACYEFVYYFSGEGNCEFALHANEFKAGTYTCVSPHIPHNERFDRHSDSLVVLFESDMLASYFQTYLVRSDRYINIREWVDRIVAEHNNKFYNYKRNIECMIELLLSEIVRKQYLQIPQQTERHSIDDIQAYFDEYYMTKIDLAEVARDCGYSVNHFRKLFVKMYGRSPKEYLLEKRLILAKKLLTSTARSIEEIGTSCGFNYYSEFALFFKRHTGVPPAAYRKQFQDDPTNRKEPPV